MRSGLSRLLGRFLLVATVALGCSKKDPAPIICYLTTLSSVSGTTTYTETLVYNDNNQVTTIVGITTGPNPSSYTESYTYDADGDLETGIFSDGTIATYTFDSNHRVTEIIFNPGGVRTYTYTSTGQHLTTTYVSNGCPSSPSCFQATATLSYPNTTTHNYSGITYTSTDFNYTATYEYDDKFNPYKQVLYSSTGSDNNPTKQVFTTGGSTTTTTYVYEYNDKGYPTFRTASNGDVSTLTYNCK